MGEVVVIQVNGDQLKDYFEKNKESGYGFMKNLSMLMARRLLNADDLLKQLLWNV